MTTKLILVTGLSGAGRSSTLATLEDAGFEAVDNLPLSLLPSLVDAAAERRPQRIAVGVDVRTRDFGPEEFLAQLDQLRARADLETQVVYLDCEDDALIRRFTETRRRHPLATDRPIGDGIRTERQRMAPIRARADRIIDTTGLGLAAFREVLTGSLGLVAGRAMTVTVISFGFRGGLPREADLVFDVRFLRNPHYEDALRPLTGQSAEVGAYIHKDPDFSAFFDHLTALLGPLLPRYEAEGKSYLTIAIGCTGGKHRSVYTAECLAAWLKSRETPVTLRHRDIPAEA